MRTIGGPSRGPRSTTWTSPPGGRGSAAGLGDLAGLVLPSRRAVEPSSTTAPRRPPIRIFQPLPMPVVTLADMSEKFVIQGGAPLSGELTVAGNKNAALPILAACLLTEEELLLAPRAAHPRHRSADRAARAARRRGRVARGQQHPPLRGRGRRRGCRRGALEADPRLLPARRPASGALRRGTDAAARRRLHRPPSPRRTPRRLRATSAPGRRRSLDRGHGARRRSAPLPRSSWTSLR